jgi:hypothetical protein
VFVSATNVTKFFLSSQDRQDDLYVRVAQLEEALEEALSSMVISLEDKQFPEGESGRFDATSFESRLALLEDQIDLLEQVMGDDLERALSVPMLKQQVEHNAEVHDEELTSIQNELDTAQFLSKVSFGLVMSLLIAISAQYLFDRKAERLSKVTPASTPEPSDGNDEQISQAR